MRKLYLTFYSSNRISTHTSNLIRKLLILNPNERLTASEVVDQMEVMIALTKRMGTTDIMQVYV